MEEKTEEFRKTYLFVFLVPRSPLIVLSVTYTVFLPRNFPLIFFPSFGSFDVKRLETFFGQTICSCNAMGYFLTP